MSCYRYLRKLSLIIIIVTKEYLTCDHAYLFDYELRHLGRIR